MYRSAALACSVLIAMFAIVAGGRHASATPACLNPANDPFQVIHSVLGPEYDFVPLGPDDPLHRFMHEPRNMPNDETYFGALFLSLNQMFGNDLAKIAEREGFGSIPALLAAKGRDALAELIDFDNPVFSIDGDDFCGGVYKIASGMHAGEYYWEVTDKKGFVVSHGIAATEGEAILKVQASIAIATTGQGVMLNPDGCADLRIGDLC